jgi:hypothetical protein
MAKNNLKIYIQHTIQNYLELEEPENLHSYGKEIQDTIPGRQDVEIV